MPQLKDTRKIIECSLPSFPDAIIKMRDGILAGDVKDLDGIEEKFMQSLYMLRRMIIEWNFTDENEQALPITDENLMLLPVKDLEFLITQTSMANDFLAKAGKTE